MITAHVSNRDTLLMPYAALAMAAFADLGGSISEQWAVTYPDNKYLADALISGYAGQEQGLQTRIAHKLPDTTSVLYQRVSTVVVELKGNTTKGNKQIMAKTNNQGEEKFQNKTTNC